MTSTANPGLWGSTVQTDQGASAKADRATHERGQSSVSPPSVGIPCAADFSISDVLEWARTKPADKRYDFSDIDNCALCQFLRETGRAKRPLVGGFSWNRTYLFGLLVGRRHAIQSGLDRALVASTFGALATRLEALLPTVSDTWTRADAYLTDRVEA